MSLHRLPLQRASNSRPKRSSGSISFARDSAMDKRNFNLIQDIANVKVDAMIDNYDEVVGQQSNDQPRSTIERDARYVNQLRLAELELSLRYRMSKSDAVLRRELRSESFVGFSSPTSFRVWFQSIELSIWESIRLIVKEWDVILSSEFSFASARSWWTLYPQPHSNLRL